MAAFATTTHMMAHSVVRLQEENDRERREKEEAQATLFRATRKRKLVLGDDDAEGVERSMDLKLSGDLHEM